MPNDSYQQGSLSAVSKKVSDEIRPCFADGLSGLIP
jgi:hypothetical protein